MARKSKQSLSSVFGRYTNFLILLIIIIIFNVLAMGMFKTCSIDLTGDKIFSLSSASKKVVSKLQEPVIIRVFISEKLPPPYNELRSSLSDLLAKYSLAASSNFTYKFFDCTISKEKENKEVRENIELARQFNISPVQIRQFDNDEVKLVDAYLGMVIQNGDMIESIPALRDTSGLEYKISHTIEKMNRRISYLQLLKTQGKEIQVQLYLPSFFEEIAEQMGIQGLKGLPRKVEEAVNDLNKKNFDIFRFSHIDESANPELAKQADQYGLFRWRWEEQQVQGEKLEAGSGTAGLVIKIDDDYEVFEITQATHLPPPFPVAKTADLSELEGTIENLAFTLLNFNDQIGYLADKGCFSIQSQNDNPYMQQMQQQQQGEAANFKKVLDQNYNLSSLKIDEIDHKLPSLIIANPEEKLSDWDLFQIDQYLMQGRSLLVFMDGLKEIQQPQQNPYQRPQTDFSPRKSGLEKLLAHYGLVIEESVIFDKSCYTNPQPGQRGPKEVPYIPRIKQPSINNDFNIMKNIKEFFVLIGSPVTLDKDKVEKNKLKAIRLFSSSKEAWTVDKAILQPWSSNPPADDKLKSYPMGWILEGEFPSYFAGKKAPENPNKDKDLKGKTTAANFKGENTKIDKGRPGKILFIGSAKLIANQLINENESNANSIMIENLVDYMNDKDEWALIRNKQSMYNPINPLGNNVKAFIKYFNIFFPVVLAILAGFLVLFFRLNRKKKIAQEYSNININ